MRFSLFCFLLLILPFSICADDYYQVGGTAPLPDDIQEELNEYRNYLRLGINTEWIAKASLNPATVAEAYLDVAKAVKAEQIPGAVILVDSFAGENIPIGAGYRMVDPEKHYAEWDTFYELGELTGAIAVVPMSLRALEHGDIQLTHSVAHYLEFLKGTPKENITIEMLLRHTSALPTKYPMPPEVRTKEDMRDLLRAIPLINEPGTAVVRSGLNFLLMGLVLEKVYEMPVQEMALKQMMMPLGMVNTVSDFPDHLREVCAPGPFSRWHRRLVWAEAASPDAYIYGASAGNGGMITTADDMALLMRTMIFAHTAGAGDMVSTPTLRSSLHPDMDVMGGQDQGLGWALNGFGEGSFGWDSPNGCSFWINPEHNLFLVILANAEHPVDRTENFNRVRDELKKKLLEAVLMKPEEARILPPPTKDYASFADCKNHVRVVHDSHKVKEKSREEFAPI